MTVRISPSPGITYTTCEVGSDGFTTYGKTFHGRGCESRARRYLASQGCTIVTMNDLVAHCDAAHAACFTVAN